MISQGRYSQANIYYAADRAGTVLVQSLDRVLFDNSVASASPLSNVRVPSQPSRTTTYTWVEGDRIDSLAYRFIGDSAKYWRILDLNPQILDPSSITPGTVLVVPTNG